MNNMVTCSSIPDLDQGLFCYHILPYNFHPLNFDLFNTTNNGADAMKPELLTLKESVGSLSEYC